MIPVVIGITVAAFAIIHLVPGDPALSILGYHATPQAIARLHHQWGLDRPFLTQYWNFVSGAARGDFGTSTAANEPVSAILGRRLGPSLLLVGFSLFTAVLFAVPLALVAALRRGTWIDHAIRVLTTVTFVMPAFWLGLVLVQIFSLRLGLLPTSGYGDTFVEHLRSLVLPAVTVGLWLAPLLLRLLRSSVIETLQTEYIEAARVRGLSSARILGKHVMRNSATSTMTVLGILAGVLLSATVVVENVFSIPGLGSLLVSSVSARDYSVVQALTMVFGLAVVISSLLTDIAYGLLDPRVRL